MALYVGGTAVTGTQTLDATTLTGNLPAINGASLTDLSAGKLIQITNTADDSGMEYNQSSTMTATSTSGTITPTSSSNKIFVQVGFQMNTATGISNTASGARFEIWRDINGGGYSAVWDMGYNYNKFGCATSTGGNANEKSLGNVNYVAFLDDPQATTAVTYKVYWNARQDFANVTAYTNNGTQNDVTLMEVDTS
jgi:hypothetical protein